VIIREIRGTGSKNMGPTEREFKELLKDCGEKDAVRFALAIGQQDVKRLRIPFYGCLLVSLVMIVLCIIFHSIVYICASVGIFIGTVLFGFCYFNSRSLVKIAKDHQEKQ
jgi:hypothetical protein